MKTNYVLSFEGLDNFTKQQIEKLALKLERKVIIREFNDAYYLEIDNLAASKIYKGKYAKNMRYPELY